jgi:hypothetical protein
MLKELNLFSGGNFSVESNNSVVLHGIGNPHNYIAYMGKYVEVNGIPYYTYSDSMSGGSYYMFVGSDPTKSNSMDKEFKLVLTYFYQGHLNECEGMFNLSIEASENPTLVGELGKVFNVKVCNNSYVHTENMCLSKKTTASIKKAFQIINKHNCYNCYGSGAADQVCDIVLGLMKKHSDAFIESLPANILALLKARDDDHFEDGKVGQETNKQLSGKNAKLEEEVKCLTEEKTKLKEENESLKTEDAELKKDNAELRFLANNLCYVATYAATYAELATAEPDDSDTDGCVACSLGFFH